MLKALCLTIEAGAGSLPVTLAPGAGLLLAVLYGFHANDRKLIQ
jgi:hypothetical protein